MKKMLVAIIAMSVLSLAGLNVQAVESRGTLGEPVKDIPTIYTKYWEREGYTYWKSCMNKGHNLQYAAWCLEHTMFRAAWHGTACAPHDRDDKSLVDHRDSINAFINGCEQANGKPVINYLQYKSSEKPWCFLSTGVQFPSTTRPCYGSGIVYGR